MKLLKKFTLIFLTAVLISAVAAMNTFAAGTYTPDNNATTSTGYFSAGGSAFLSGGSTVSAYDGSFDIYLSSYQYTGMAINARPYNSSIVFQPYTENYGSAAGSEATISLAGYGYSYSYYSGYGGTNQKYYLKAHSTYTGLAATTTVQWHA